MSMKRRSFFKNTAIVAASALVAPQLFAKTVSKRKYITILHTNDTHAQFDAFSEDHPLYPARAGVDERDQYFKRVKAEGNSTLILDSGDFFKGTAYFEQYQGLLEVKTMSDLGYDAVGLGNHDFALGLEGLESAISKAKFAVCNSNYRFKNPKLNSLIQPYRIFHQSNVKIGVFGIGISLKGLADESVIQQIEVKDPIQTANQTAKTLRDLHCDFVICLSQLGYEYPGSNQVSDVQLASQSDEIDLIIGGHTHSVLEQPKQILNKKNKPVIINQVGWGGLNVGRMDFCIDKSVTLVHHKLERICKK